MPLPVGVETVTVSSGQPLTLPDGTAMSGDLTFTGPELVTISGEDVVLGGAKTVALDETGNFSVRLVATDATGMDPAGWTYRVDGSFTNAPGWTRYISLPRAAPTVKLASVVVPDPVTGQFSTLVTVDSLGGAALLDVGEVAGTVAAGDDPRFGTIGGIAVTGTPAAGKVPTATSGSAISWQTPSGGGGGSSIRTAMVRITDDNLSGLPSASSWTIVTTSGGTPLQCSIAAAANDRIRVCGAFMRNGSHFLDWVMLDSAGAIAQYATTGTGTAPTEGNPTMYPSLSFSYVTSDDMFTVGSGNLNGGLVTIALAHQGVASGIVYAHPTYPWRLRLENIGPEPA